jgi:hypothetical protein
MWENRLLIADEDVSIILFQILKSKGHLVSNYLLYNAVGTV